MLIICKRGDDILELGERKLKILAAIIDLYVKTSEPISSKTLCDLPDFFLSSATIRNEMAELTELGYLEQPHTSAGRIPSHLGYRLYINKLMNKKRVSKQSKKLIDSSLIDHIATPEKLLKQASLVLADLTNLAVISTNILANFDAIKEIQLIKTTDHTGLIILITSTGIVKNSFFKCNYILTDAILNKISIVINEKFAKILLIDITEEYINRVLESLKEIIHLIDSILMVIYKSVQEAIKFNIQVENQTNLLLSSDFNSSSIISINNFLSKDNNITNFLLNVQDNNTCVLIGKEAPFEPLNDSSIIVTQFNVSGKSLGFIGTIGPIRMDYCDTIASIEYIASSISDILGDILNFD